MSVGRYAEWLQEQHEDLVLPSDLEEFDFLEALTPDRVHRDLRAHLSPTEIALVEVAESRRAA